MKSDEKGLWKHWNMTENTYETKRDNMSQQKDEDETDYSAASQTMKTDK